MTALLPLMPHTVTVETYLGEGGFGPAYGDPADIRCLIDEKIQLVRDVNGQEVTSTTTIYAQLADAPALTVGTRVTVNGQPATVLTLARHTAGPRFGPIECCEAALT